jgi:hypothetical protein
MAQQTLEESAKEYGITIGNKDGTAQFDFIKGAKWQQERMYSEEEVLKLLITFSDDRTFLKKDVAIQWFEQIKK